MAKRFKTFRPKRVKQVRDWAKTTHARSFTKTVEGSSQFSMSEVTPEEQLRKLDHSIKRRKAQIEGYKKAERIHSARLTDKNGNPDGGKHAADLRAQIARGESAMTMKYFHRELLLDKVAKKEEGRLKRGIHVGSETKGTDFVIRSQEVTQREEDLRRLNHEKTEKLVERYGTKPFHISDLKPPVLKQKIEKNPRGGRKVKTVMQPRFEKPGEGEQAKKAPDKLTVVERGRRKAGAWKRTNG